LLLFLAFDVERDLLFLRDLPLLLHCAPILFLATDLARRDFDRLERDLLRDLPRDLLRDLPRDLLRDLLRRPQPLDFERRFFDAERLRFFDAERLFPFDFERPFFDAERLFLEADLFLDPHRPFLEADRLLDADRLFFDADRPFREADLFFTPGWQLRLRDLDLDLDLEPALFLLVASSFLAKALAARALAIFLGHLEGGLLQLLLT